jgi:hypothetical protein
VLLCKKKQTQLKSHPNTDNGYCDARQLICFMIRDIWKDGYSYRAIAEMMGKTLKNGKGDHALAIYWDRTANDRIETKDPKFLAKLDKIKCEIFKKSLPLDQ